jgi:predicted ATP-dependent serine protease
MFVTTGDAELDRLLATDVENGGLPLGIQTDNTTIETTVVLIEGGAGGGKTTLALQIVSHAARSCAVSAETHWC